MWQKLAIRGSREAVRQGRVFAKTVLPAVVKPARTLWNEVIGFMFACIAVIAGFRAGRLYVEYAGTTPEGQGGAMMRFVVAAGFTLLMAYFAITSFLKARRISRS